MNNPKSITATIDDVHVKIHVFAKRGDVYYGVGRSPRNYICLVEMVETASGDFVVEEIKHINFYDICAPADGSLDSKIKSTISVFLANAYLKDQFPDLQNKVSAKIKELISKIPQAEVFNF